VDHDLEMRAASTPMPAHGGIAFSGSEMSGRHQFPSHVCHQDPSISINAIGGHSARQLSLSIWPAQRDDPSVSSAAGTPYEKLGGREEMQVAYLPIRRVKPVERIGVSEKGHRSKSMPLVSYSAALEFETGAFVVVGRVHEKPRYRQRVYGGDDWRWGRGDASLRPDGKAIPRDLRVRHQARR
jgi:hypothetical protein